MGTALNWNISPSGGSYPSNGTNTYTAIVNFSTVKLSANYTITALNLGGGNLVNTAVLTNAGGAGTLNLQGGIIYGNGTGGLLSANGATLTLSSAGHLAQYGLSTFGNNGTFVVNPGSGQIFGSGFLMDNAGITDVEGGTHSLLGGVSPRPF